MLIVGTSDELGNPDAIDLGEIAARNMRAAAELNEQTGQRGSSWIIPAEDGALANIPVWSGREEWKRELHQALYSEAGLAACKRLKINPEKVKAVAIMHALNADDRTGRRMAVGMAKLVEATGVSERHIRRARTVLVMLKLAVEAARGRYLSAHERLAAALHHGGRQIRAASTWALTSPREWIRETQEVRYPQIPNHGLLPRGSSFDLSTPVGSNSPTRASARGQKIASTREGSRPVELQRLAAELVARTHGLDHGHLIEHEHIGALCDVLTRAGIDPQRWTALDIKAMLDADAQRRGWIWPAVIEKPAAFLRQRLRGLSFTGPSPSERAAEQRAAARQRQAAAEEARAGSASATARAAAIALFQRSRRMK